MTPEIYRQFLLRPLAAPGPEALARAPELPSRIWSSPPEAPWAVSFRDLYNNGVLCGHKSTRAVLEFRIDIFDEEIEGVRGERQAALAEKARLERDLRDFRDAHES